MESSAVNIIFRFALVIFLTEAKVLPSAGLLNEMPSNCSNKDFCLLKHDDYPQDKIDYLLTKKYHLSLGDPHENYPIDRTGLADEIQDDCKKIIDHGEIYEIIDQDGNVRVVVQSPTVFKQQIRIEECATPGRLLVKGGTDHFSSEELELNEINCVEKKLHYSFLVLSKDGERLESVKSKNGIPVCCACKLNIK